jgi:hypothetical protein
MRARTGSGFPRTVRDEVHPTDPRAERTRAEILANPETPAQQLERTRRIFRLNRRVNRQQFAGGLEYHLEA